MFSYKVNKYQDINKHPGKIYLKIEASAISKADFCPKIIRSLIFCKNPLICL